MRHKSARNEVVWSFLFCLELLKKVHESRGIISGCILVLHAEQVSLAFRIATELQIGKGHRKTGDLTNRETHRPTKEDQGKGSILRDLPTGQVSGCMSCAYVRDLVRHHSGQLGFIVCGENQ